MPGLLDFLGTFHMQLHPIFLRFYVSTNWTIGFKKTSALLRDKENKTTLFSKKPFCFVKIFRLFFPILFIHTSMLR